MTKDLKDLLLKDLCARLPYKTKIQLTEYSDLTGEKLPSKIKSLDYCMLGKVQAYCKGFRKDEVKPYLFPLSSMTEEQAKEMQEIVGSPKVACIMRKTGGLELWLDSVDTDPTIWLDTIFEVQDWLNKNHFDHRGLIPKGLAKDATGLNIY